jgi:biopolymer transport protein ExbD
VRKKKTSYLEEPSINITPLIDVVFVVLIMFIIIAPILEKDRIQLSQNGSQNKNSKIEKTSALNIHVNSKNELFLNKKQIPLHLLEPSLKKLKTSLPETIPQVYYDKKAYFEFFEPIKCALENAGFSDMDLILEPST